METSLRRAVLEAKRVPLVEGAMHAAVAIVLCGPELEVLFIRRAERSDDPWSGHMALPGGRREPFDKSLEQTALRETLEEVGVDLRAAELWGSLSPMAARSSGRQERLWVTPYVYRIDGLRPRTRPDALEVAEVVWVPIAALLSPQSQTQWTISRPEGKLTLPAWQIGPRVIWGLTHAILMQLLKHAAQRNRG